MVDMLGPFLPAGTNSYMLFTLDKLIAKFVKQLQTLMADERNGCTAFEEEGEVSASKRQTGI